MDYLHYLNDILLLEINDLNAVLTEHLLHKLFVPLYIYSLTPAPPSLAVVTQNLAAVLNRNVDIDIQEINNPRVSSIVALYLLSLVFLVVTHGPLVHALAWVILNGDQSVFKEGAAEILNSYVENREVVVPGFAEPPESLEEALDTVIGVAGGVNNSSGYSYAEETMEDENTTRFDIEGATAAITTPSSLQQTLSSAAETNAAKPSLMANITDEEKQQLQQKQSTNSTLPDFNRPFLETVLSALDCSENDYLALLALCLIYAMAYNRGRCLLLYFSLVLSLY